MSGVGRGLVGVPSSPRIATPACKPKPCTPARRSKPTAPRCRGLVGVWLRLVGLNMQHFPTLTLLAISLRTSLQWRGVPTLTPAPLRVVACGCVLTCKEGGAQHTISPHAAVARSVREFIAVWLGLVRFGWVWLRLVADRKTNALSTTRKKCTTNYLT